MKRNFTPIYIGQDDTTGTGATDPLDAEFLKEQAEKDARAERITSSISDLLVTGFGLFKSDDKDTTKPAAGSGSAAAPSVNVTVPGTNINAGMLIVPAAIIGGIMLLTSKRRRR